MFGDFVPEFILEHCKKQLEQYNFGKRGFADGNKNEQLTGIIGQTTITSLFHKGMIDGSQGFDGGKDFEYEGLKIDIKTMGRTCEPRPDFVNNLIGLQAKYDTDAYVFCSYNTKTNFLTVCGWIPKYKFLSEAKFCMQGTTRTRTDGTSFVTKADLFELENRNLLCSRNFKEMKAQLDSYSKKGIL